MSKSKSKNKKAKKNSEYAPEASKKNSLTAAAGEFDKIMAQGEGKIFLEAEENSAPILEEIRYFPDDSNACRACWLKNPDGSCQGKCSACGKIVARCYLVDGMCITCATKAGFPRV